MKTLTHSAFVATLAAMAGACPVGLEVKTDTNARKRNNPFGQIFKRSRFVGFVGANYEKGVRRERARQGAAWGAAHFETEGLPWGQWLVAGKVITHKGKYFLRTQSVPRQRERQPATVLGYYDKDGNFLSYRQVSQFLPPPTISTKQSQAGLISWSGFTDDDIAQVHVRNFSFDSIQKVRINGETFQLIP